MNDQLIRAVLFDLDDTLPDRRRTLERSLAQHAGRAALSDEASATYRRRFLELDDGGSINRLVLFDLLSRELPSIGTFETLWQDYRTHVWTCCQIMDGATNVLDWCRSVGLRRAIITNGSPDTQWPKVHSLGLADRVDAVLISEVEGISKPQPALFHRAAERLGVCP